jgi:hypothetical protein
MLDRVSIAAPCSADWDQMAGTDQVRHCTLCNKNVYNLSAMTRGQAEALLRETEGRLCARLYRRADGTVLTENCPVGLRAIGRRISRVAGAAMSAVATLSSAAAAQFPFFPIPSALQEAKAAVSGVILDITGRGISDAKVVITQAGSKSRQLTNTDGAGSFRIESLAAGAYTIQVVSPGFRSYTKQMLLTPFHNYKIQATLLLGTMGGPMVVEPAK